MLWSLRYGVVEYGQVLWCRHKVYNILLLYFYSRLTTRVPYYSGEVSAYQAHYLQNTAVSRLQVMELKDGRMRELSRGSK